MVRRDEELRDLLKKIKAELLKPVKLSEKVKKWEKGKEKGKEEKG